jgi:hypothetical protein
VAARTHGSSNHIWSTRWTRCHRRIRLRHRPELYSKPGKGIFYDDAIASSTLAPGQVILSTWLRTMFTIVFADELGANLGTVQGNTLIHVLDDRLGSGSGCLQAATISMAPIRMP